MEVKCQPYIIYLTECQEEVLLKYFIHKNWQIRAFKRIQHDLRFLFDLLIEDEKLDIYLLKQVLCSQRPKHSACPQKEMEFTDKGLDSSKGQLHSTKDKINVAGADLEENAEKIVLNFRTDVLNQDKKSLHLKGREPEEVWENDEHKLQFVTDSKETEAMAVIHEEVILADSNIEYSTNGKDRDGRKGNEADIAKCDKYLTAHAGHRSFNISGVRTNINSNRKRRSIGRGCAVAEKANTRGKIMSRGSCSNQRHTAETYEHDRLSNKEDIKTQFKCQTCGKVVSSDRNLKRHVKRLHSEVKTTMEDQELSACQICRKQFVDKYALTAHHHTMHSDKRDVYQCDICGAIMKHKGNLVQHKKSVHSDQRTHKCDVCDNTFKLYQQLKTHKRRHDPDYVDTCIKCGKTFRKGHLTTHMKRHSYDKKFNCNTCAKTFFEKQELERHIILHSGERPNKCPHCPYACAFKGNLTKHIKHKHGTEFARLVRTQKYQLQKRNPLKKSTENKILSYEQVHNESASTHITNHIQIETRNEHKHTLPSIQNLHGEIMDSSSVVNGNSSILGEMKQHIDIGGENELSENWGGQVFADTHDETCTAESRLHVLKPVSHMNSLEDERNDNFVSLKEATFSHETN